MAEAKNTFTRSKMNQDLDDRLLPNNEYRRGDNIVISQSNEGVGSLEIIKGNVELSNLGYSSTTLVEIIGVKEDPKRNRIYCFVTNYRDSSFDYISNPAPSQAVCAIIAFNIIDNTHNVLVLGNFLNFSKLSPIINVDVLEDLLFWTDDRNQPRVINIETALTSSTYYSHEDHISVAKYYPWKPIKFKLKNVSDEWQPIYAYGHISSIGGGTYTSGTNIPWELVPRYGGFFPGEFNTPAGPPSPDVYVFRENDLDTKIKVNETDLALSSNQDPGFRIFNMKLDEDITLDPDEMIYFASKNPDYDPNYEGDKSFFEEKFLKFSYRFKYQDNTYSLIAPFTQTTFIPKNDGYFSTFPENDIQVMMDTTENPIMVNKVDCIELEIKNPGVNDPFNSCSVFNEIIDKYKIESIEIILKDADQTSLQVVDIIDRSDIQLTTTENFNYKYVGTNPFNTLPESETVRVFDQVPARAKAQASSANRIMYGNIVKRKNHPKQINFGIEANRKYAPTGSNSPESVPKIITPGDNIERYPNHSLKQNRTYKAGIVLVDRYGRQSYVITSLNKTGINFSQDTVFSDYRKTTVVNNTFYGGIVGLNINSGWYGDSMKLAVREQIPSLQNGAVISSNPYNETGQDHIANDYTGWMTYKVVVQQRDQDYYNVYHPGFFNGGYKILRNTLTEEENAISPIIAGSTPGTIGGTGPQDPSITTGTYTIYQDGSAGALGTLGWKNGYQLPPNDDNPDYIGTGKDAVFQVVVSIQGTETKYEITALEGGEGFNVGDVIFIPYEAIGGSTVPNPYGDLYLTIQDFVINEISFEEPDKVSASGVFSTQSDNLNKVPKDVTDVGPAQTIFNSNQKLYARVTNAIGGYYTKPAFAGGFWNTSLKSHPWYPEESHVVNRIGTGKDLGLYDNVGQAPDFIINARNNPFLAGVKADSIDFGVPAKLFNAEPPKAKALPYLGIYETEPFESKLDIYYETSTSGTIKELNDTVADEEGMPFRLTREEPPASGFIPDGTGRQDPVMYLRESDPIGKNICSQNGNSGSGNSNKGVNGADQVSPPATTAGGPGIGYWSISGSIFESISDPPLSSNINIFLQSVLDGYGNERKQDFELVWPMPVSSGDPSSYIGRFYIKTTTFLTNGADFNTRENYTFYVVVEDILGNIQIPLQPVSYQLGNAVPTIQSIEIPCGTTYTLTGGVPTSNAFLTRVRVTNGSADPDRDTEGITFEIDSTPPNLIGDPYFYFDISSTAGEYMIYARMGTPLGTYTVTYTATDAPGVSVTCVNTITIAP
tara:strand:+ start:1589 stop:5434 length:3846 start_codon:yes stop_codon:yes gene_type:complete